MAVRIILEDAHLKPSPRLLVGVALLASLVTTGLWGALGRWALIAWVAALPMLVLALRYVAGSWVRVSAHRGLSWCLKTPFGTRLGSVELLPADIAELRLEASLAARLLGLWDLQIVRRDGTVLPPFRFFAGMDRQAEILHGYLEQLGRL
ncbi:MAG TPA: hypothetical protein VJ623_08755 [Holophagaceae bacterium]|nr:hypothetical protein [Holophagaceae bacterium]